MILICRSEFFDWTHTVARQKFEPLLLEHFGEIFDGILGHRTRLWTDSLTLLLSRQVMTTSL